MMLPVDDLILDTVEVIDKPESYHQDNLVYIAFVVCGIDSFLVLSRCVLLLEHVVVDVI